MELIMLGLILMIIGIAIIVVGTLLTALKAGRGEVKSGGVLLIGPFPIVWGSSSKLALAATVIAIIILISMTLLIMMR
ncbi:MAG: DUF131 domain-containing protein [archaeon GB-1867-005]|nr:DUF131 domain-containing protein [Candidatus Culexmicrobium cathedralense]